MIGSHSLALELEERSMRALPALVTRAYDGWILRFGEGYTRRANSVYPLYPSSLPLEDKLAQIEGFYRKVRLPVCFKLTPQSPDGRLEALLDSTGYELSPPTHVQICDLEHFASPEPDAALLIYPRFSSEWFAAYARLSQIEEAKRSSAERIIRSIIPRTGYGMIVEQGAPVALGLAVVDEEWVGIFDVVVHPQARRRGLGTRIVHGLLAWAQAQNAQRAYLQVFSENSAALALYHGLGFRDVYSYWYRQRNFA